MKFIKILSNEKQDSIKKIHDDLKSLIFVEGDIIAADEDNQGYDLNNLISIMKKWLNSSIWDMESDEFRMEFGDWEEKDEDVFWPYANNKIEMKNKLRKDFNKLKIIYKKSKNLV